MSFLLQILVYILEDFAPAFKVGGRRLIASICGHVGPLGLRLSVPVFFDFMASLLKSAIKILEGLTRHPKSIPA
jgi:hypothetical protein